MPSSRNTLLSAEQTTGAMLDILDQHKERLCAIVECEESTPDDKYEALMRLASLTGVLTSLAAEYEPGQHLDTDRHRKPRVIFSDRMDCGVVVGFDDGKTAYYSSKLLHAVLPHAQMMPTDSDSAYRSESG